VSARRFVCLLAICVIAVGATLVRDAHASPTPAFHFRVDLTYAAGFPVVCGSMHQFGYGRYVAGVALVGYEIVLAPETCTGFDQPWFRQDSLVTLGHERAHMLGIKNEQAAERKGIRDAPWLARRLGFR
jgi:hypothetical protein